MAKKPTATEAFAEWLDEGLSQEGKSNSELARRLGLPQSRVSEMRKLKRKPQPDELKIIAEYLEKPLPPELVPLPTSHHRIPLAGEVQAGKWVAPNSDGFEDETFDIPLPEVYNGLKPYALRVVGQSMNLVYPEGTILICCHIEKLHEDPIPGKRYIIEDIDPSGDVETTVKELVLDAAGRPWAWPRSTHPEYQAPVALDQGRDGHTIRVAARVVFALRPE